MDHSASVPSNALGARVAPEQPKKFTPTENLVPKPAAAPTWVRTNAHLTPSEKPVLGLNLNSIKDSVAKMVTQHDRNVAEANGQAVWRLDAANLDAAVKRGELNAEQAEQIWMIVHRNQP